jgi:hypothetical protein
MCSATNRLEHVWRGLQMSMPVYSRAIRLASCLHRAFKYREDRLFLYSRPTPQGAQFSMVSASFGGILHPEEVVFR